MPLVKIDHIVSFSTEDPVHIANNILSSDVSKKWKCKATGEKNAVVVMQLDKACVITGIDIGNEHSAYIEVLVSRSGTNDDYKVLLVMSAFMTPLESRQSQNVNKVRMFTKDQLSTPECDEKWDRIKIVCTQPFNKHVQYGLSFVNFHTSESKPAVTSGQTYIGKFLVRPDSPDNISIGSLFSKRKELKQEEKLTGAAAIREAGSSSSLALHGSPVCKPKLKTRESLASVKKETTLQRGNSESSHSSDSNDSEVKRSRKPRLRDEILYSKDEEEPNDKIDNIIDKKTKELEDAKDKKQNSENISKKKQNLKDDFENQKKKEKEEKERKKVLDSSKKNSLNNNKEKDKELKRKHKDHSEDRKQKKKLKKDRITKPFNRLLEGVTVVISGIQNPDRANLRTLALSMGAKYKADWNDNCTHLICAFTNTPKFNQVKGKGKIVKRTWIEDCHAQRKRLPWRRYALDKNDLNKGESEDEIWETVATQESSKKDRDIDTDSDTERHSFSNEEEYVSDTEKRLDRLVEQRNKKNKARQEQDLKPTVYTVDTDDEDDCEDVTISEKKYKLLDIFDNKKFYIDQTFEEEQYKKLKKYIIAYKGITFDSPTEDLDFIVTTRINSGTLKEINNKAQCVSPNWIWNCHNSQELVLIDNYLF